MDNIGIAYNADKSWPVANVTSGECYGGVGSGGFLVEAIRDIWRKVETRGASLGWPDSEIAAEKQEVAIKNIRGIDKDNFLSKVAKAYMAIIGDGRGGVMPPEIRGSQK